MKKKTFKVEAGGLTVMHLFFLFFTSQLVKITLLVNNNKKENPDLSHVSRQKQADLAVQLKTGQDLFCVAQLNQAMSGNEN